MSKQETLADILQRQGITRRGFLKFCTAMASLMALPPGMAPADSTIKVVNGLMSAAPNPAP